MLEYIFSSLMIVDWMSLRSLALKSLERSMTSISSVLMTQLFVHELFYLFLMFFCFDFQVVYLSLGYIHSNLYDIKIIEAMVHIQQASNIDINRLVECFQFILFTSSWRRMRNQTFKVIVSVSPVIDLLLRIVISFLQNIQFSQ